MVIKEKIWIKPYECERTLHIYVPDQKEENERFPVLYMFDGHNLFFDEEATYGKSWGLKKYLDEHHSRVIVVGLECNHVGNERLSEFTPYSFYEDEWENVPEKGRVLIEWMKTDLKKWVDNHYPTLSDRAHTYVGGSSMGGLMSLYMAMKHSDTYSKAACVSPHIYPVYKALREDLECDIMADTQIYISWGGHEYSPHIMAMATDQNLQILRALLKKPGVDVIPHCFKNDDHSEAAWEKELPVWMKELNIG
ncbi:MAG: alpha/beta hydrolase [Erysipelotrichaceae bacterium]|nr:alpha/beta hydrolase [Erysipelotrichaceae bacterium]